MLALGDLDAHAGAEGVHVHCMTMRSSCSLAGTLGFATISMTFLLSRLEVVASDQKTAHGL